MYFYCPGCDLTTIVDEFTVNDNGECRYCGGDAWFQTDKKPYKVIVAGGREFTDYTLMKTKLNKILGKIKDRSIVIISGKASGADSLGEVFAKEKGYPVVEKPADWKRFWKRAGIIRNEEMATIADACVIFWDGKSPGSKNMKEICERKTIPHRVIRYE